MSKALAYNRQGLLGRTSITKILPQAPTTNQVISELSHYISDRSLTEALILLENHGITGDLAIFIMANLQSLEVAR